MGCDGGTPDARHRASEPQGVRRPRPTFRSTSSLSPPDMASMCRRGDHEIRHGTPLYTVRCHRYPRRSANRFSLRSVRMRLHSRRSYALLSVAAALVTMALKFGAFTLTGSVGLLSDALESVVNLVAALVAVLGLTPAAPPAHEKHTYLHTQAQELHRCVRGGAGARPPGPT